MDDILDLRISDLYFSVRVENALRRIDVYTLKDLTRCSSEDLNELQNLGRKSLYEIREKLDQYGLCLLNEGSLSFGVICLNCKNKISISIDPHERSLMSCKSFVSFLRHLERIGCSHCKEKKERNK